MDSMLHWHLRRDWLRLTVGSSHQQLLLAQEFQGHQCFSRADRLNTVEMECSLKEWMRWILECNCCVTPKNTPRGPLWPEQQRLQLATPSEDPPSGPTPHTSTQPNSRETMHKRAESGFYWIKPLSTVLEYGGTNSGTEGGLCQQPVFA